ncbi:MAG: DUF3592 domain-containing protein [Arachnia sp.]
MVLAVGFAVLAFYEFSVDHRLQLHGLRADAVVIDDTSGRHGSTTIRFTDADGEIIETTIRKDEDRAEVGARIPIVYDLDDPGLNSAADTVGDTSWVVYGSVVMSVFCAVMAILIGGRIIDWERWVKRRT